MSYVLIKTDQTWEVLDGAPSVGDLERLLAAPLQEGRSIPDPLVVLGGAVLWANEDFISLDTAGHFGRNVLGTVLTQGMLGPHQAVAGPVVLSGWARVDGQLLPGSLDPADDLPRFLALLGDTKDTLAGAPPAHLPPPVAEAFQQAAELSVAPWPTGGLLVEGW